jgi:hypothetical protein
MKAITIWQPWATLIELGVKRIETRSWATKYRGPIAIHAAARMPASGMVGDYYVRGFGRTGLALEGPGLPKFRSAPRLQGHLIPRGAVVAIADLVGCIPTERLMFHETVEIDGKDFGPMPGLLGKHGYVAVESNQRPYGDFTWGRFAWMLENIRSVDPHVRAKGRQQIWNWDEPLELAGGTRCLAHSQSEPCGTCRGYIAAGL